MKNAGGAPSYPIESVNSALRLLKLLHQRPLRVSEVAEELEVAPSTAHRLLAMLRYHGMAEQDLDTRAYRPGLALIQIGLSAVRGLDLRDVARTHLEHLARELGETVHLSIARDTEVVVIDSVESSQSLRVGALTGAMRPAHVSAAGWVYLAHLEPDAVKALYPSRRIPARDDYPPVPREALLKEVERVRELGYAVRIHEARHVAGVALPLVDRAGRFRGAVALALPVNRFDESQLPSMLDVMKRSVKAVDDLLT